MISLLEKVVSLITIKPKSQKLTEIAPDLSRPKNSANVTFGGEVLTIDKLVSLETDIPNIEVIDRKKEVPSESRIPSYTASILTKKCPDEPVWLTYAEILERLRKLMHMSSRFNLSPRGAQAVEQKRDSIFDRGMTLATGRKDSISNNEVASEFQKMGFSFASCEGKVFLLVDATVPARDNVPGETYISQPVILQQTGSYVVAAKTIETLDERTGFRPLNEHSTHVVCVPLEEILSIHNENTPISSMQFADSDNDVQGGIVRRLQNEPAFGILESVGRVLFKEIKNNNAFRQELDDVSNLIYCRGSVTPEEHAKLKKMIFKFLSSLGLSPMVGKGDLPYEPRYYFVHEKNRKEVESVKSLEYISTDNPDDSLDLRLEQMLEVVSQAYITLLRKPEAEGINWVFNAS